MEVSKYVLEKNIMVLEIKGEVDAYTSRELNKNLAQVLEDGYHQIVMDVSQLTFISSAGLRAILYAYREAVHLGGEVRLVGPSDQVRRTFEIAGFFELMQITDELKNSIRDW